MRGETYFHEDRLREALREFLQVDILYDAPRWQAAALLEAGKVYERLDQWADAAETYSRLVARFPQDPDAADGPVPRRGGVQESHRPGPPRQGKVGESPPVCELRTLRAGKVARRRPAFSRCTTPLTRPGRTHHDPQEAVGRLVRGAGRRHDRSSSSSTGRSGLADDPGRVDARRSRRPPAARSGESPLRGEWRRTSAVGRDAARGAVADGTGMSARRRRSG